MDRNHSGTDTTRRSNRGRHIIDVETSIAAFIGYTEKARSTDGRDLTNEPTRIVSLQDFEASFGGAHEIRSIEVTVARDDHSSVKFVRAEPQFYLYDSIRLFFDNGGSVCYVISLGDYDSDLHDAYNAHMAGLSTLQRYSEPTLIVCPDAVLLYPNQLHKVQQIALDQCGHLQNRIVILDLPQIGSDDLHSDVIQTFRESIGDFNLMFGAAYTPWLYSNYEKDIDLALLLGNVYEESGSIVNLTAEQDQKIVDSIANQARGELNKIPPSGAVAGAFAAVDRARGVWRAPASIRLESVLGPSIAIDDAEQADLNVDPVGGKSINAIRAFEDSGTLIWGARTLAGNDGDWRYLPVRRFVNQLQESVMQSTSWVIFERNDAALWSELRAMLDEYLMKKWTLGALRGATPEEAFFVSVGLGQSMTKEDIDNGRIVIELGIALFRPAEFFVLELCHASDWWID